MDKIDVPERWWDNLFAPSSCFVLITTLDAGGRTNAAAFGTCTRVCHDPMFLSFSANLGSDTAENAEATGEFVVNVVPFEADVLEKALICGLPFRPGTDELERSGLTPVASTTLSPPRIAECRSHFECTVEWMQRWQHRVMICGRVKAVTVNQNCIDEAGFAVWEALRPAHYCGGGYGNMFVPVYHAPLAVPLRYQGYDCEFRDGSGWRELYKPYGGVGQIPVPHSAGSGSGTRN